MFYLEETGDSICILALEDYTFILDLEWFLVYIFFSGTGFIFTVLISDLESSLVINNDSLGD